MMCAAAAERRRRVDRREQGAVRGGGRARPGEPLRRGGAWCVYRRGIRAGRARGTAGPQRSGERRMVSFWTVSSTE